MEEQKGIGQDSPEASTGGYTFELEDGDGQTHQYHVGKKHEPIARSKGPSGLRLLNHVAKVAGTPLAEFVSTNAGQLMQMYTKAKRSASEEDVKSIQDALESEEFEDAEGSIDLELTAALEYITEAFDQIDPEIVLQKILYFTSRDGENLRKDVAFNQAYRGNYIECLRAVYEVCVYNGFFGSLGGLIDV